MKKFFLVVIAIVSIAALSTTAVSYANAQTVSDHVRVPYVCPWCSQTCSVEVWLKGNENYHQNCCKCSKRAHIVVSFNKDRTAATVVKVEKEK